MDTNYFECIFMVVDVYNHKNEKAGKMELSDKIFKTKWNPDLVHQAIAAQTANRREVLAHAKGRGEVRGGGRKPWKQKGTGRARHGSIRSPLWKGGGVTFGPVKEKIFSRKINKKMRKLAIWSVLSKKLKDEELKILDTFGIEEMKTKNLLKLIKNLSARETSNLIVPSRENKSIKRIAANIPKAEAISPLSLNLYDLLRYKNIIFEKKAVEELESHYQKS